jgi:hypothetical protein
VTKLDRFTEAYLEAAEFSGLPTDDHGEEEPNEGFSPELIAQAVADCAAFQEAHWDDVSAYGVEQAGHDFWFTRNRHGVGFWENDHGTPEICGRLDKAARAAGEIEILAGDDGLLYFFPGPECAK